MRPLLFIFLLFSFPAIAQDEDELLFFNYRADSTSGKLVKMPEPNRKAFYSFLNMAEKKSSKHTVTSDSLYKKIFSDYLPDSLPVIDFTTSELVVSYHCIQCIVSCRPGSYGCHRNACMYKYVWHVRNKNRIN